VATELVYFRSAGLAEGAILPKDKACISPNDRGFLLGDGVYEVIRSYKGKLFRPDEHLARLRHSLDAVRIRWDMSELPGNSDPVPRAPILLELLERNDLARSDATVLIQITRGVCPRMTAVPTEPLPPTVYVETSPLTVKSEEMETGVAVITVPDIRWGRCDLKAIGLLPNVLARMQATDAGAAEAVFVRDGIVTEGTHTNVFGVLGGAVLTHAADNHILAGITRGVVLELCRSLGIRALEDGIRERQLSEMDELFLSATTAEVTPVVSVNRRPVRGGKPGPITRRLQSAFRLAIESQLKTTAKDAKSAKGPELKGDGR
jgi:D-alanine transaminase